MYIASPLATQSKFCSTPDTSTAKTVSELVGNAPTIPELCNQLQQLGHEYQSDIRALIRDNHELQTFLRIDSHNDADLSHAINSIHSGANNADMTVEIQRSIWLLELLIADVQEHYPNANEHLHNALVWHQNLLLHKSSNQPELIQKEKALNQLAEYLTHHLSNSEHHALIQQIMMTCISTEEIDQLPKPSAFNATMRQTLAPHVSKDDLADRFPYQLEKNAKHHFKNLSHRSLNELVRPIDNLFEKAVYEAQLGKRNAATTSFMAAIDKSKTLVTQEDRHHLFRAGLLNKPTDIAICNREHFQHIKSAIRNSPEKELTPLERAVQHHTLNSLVNASTLPIRAEMNKGERQWRTQYHPENNGKYPIRDEAGNPVRIIQIAPMSEDTELTTIPVKPFINSQTTEAARAALYNDYLLCRPFSVRDQRHTNEACLVGQNTVVAKQMIRTGQCLGVYGGQINSFANIQDRTYVLSVSSDNQIAIDGDNVLSKINTLLKYSAAGIAYDQADTGYNVEFRAFKVKLATPIAGKQDILLPIVVASTDIQPGEELRINYHYTTRFVASIFNR